MGTLGGHLLPGSMFIGFAIWWGFVTSLRFVQMNYYSRSRGKSNSSSRNNNRSCCDAPQRCLKEFKHDEIEYRSTVWMPCVCLPCGRCSRRVPIECWLQAGLAFFGVVAEFFTGLSRVENMIMSNSGDVMSMPTHGHGHSETFESHSHMHERSAVMPSTKGVAIFNSWQLGKGNTQHMTMYSAFILQSIVNIMIYHGVELPAKLAHVLFSLAFAVEAFLFSFHLHAKEVVEVNLHILLIYAIMGCAISSLLEAFNDREILFTYGRVAFTIVQGTWFYQTGFMLYPPTEDPAWHYDLSDHSLVMITTVCFCWHVMLVVIGLMLQYWFVRRMYLNASDAFRARLDELIENDNRRKDYCYRRPGQAAPHLALNSEDEDLKQVITSEFDDDNKNNY